VTEFRILGPLVVRRDSAELEVRGPRQRALLALLLVHANEVLAADRIAELLWRGNPPRTATNTLQTHVVRLRRALRIDDADARDGPLRTLPAGYVLDVDPDGYDVTRFESLLGEARRAASLERHTAARGMLGQALNLWRGPAFVEFAAEPFAQVEATRLHELWIDARQEYAVASLACGRIAEAVTILQPIVREHPLREQPVGHLMVALYRARRQRDALDAYRTLRLALRDQLGVDPSPELQRLEQSILDHAPDLELVAIGRSRQASALPVPAIAVAAGPPFVGRTEELAWLGNQWYQACRGIPRLAVLCGETGIGKTRVAAEFAERCHRGGTRVLWARCTEQAMRPFEPFAHALSPAIGEVSAATSLWELVEPPDAMTLRNDPEAARHDVFKAAVAMLERVAEDAPVLLVFDDMQWADRSTLALLALFLRTAPTACVLVLATVGTTELGEADTFVQTVEALTHEGFAASHELRGLAPGSVSSLIANIATSPPSAAFDAAVQARAQGNPFFVTELLRHLDEATGRDASRPGVLDDLDDLDLPLSVITLIERRVARLRPAARTTLEIAAVAGTEFDPDVVADAMGSDRATLRALLEEVGAAAVAQPVDDTGRVYAFSHGLVRQALYDGIATMRRAHLHESIGEALSLRFDRGDTQHLAHLAHHFALANSSEATRKSISFGIRAGDAALEALAYEEAYAHFDAALGLLDRSDGTDDVGTRADLVFARARALYASGERARAKHDFEQVAEVYRRMQEPGRLTKLALGISGSSMRHLWSDYGTVSDWLVQLVREALESTEGDETPERGRLLARLAEELYFSDDAEFRTAVADDALRMARRVGDVAALADALNGRLRALWRPENSADRLETARELRDLAVASGDAELLMSAEGWSIVADLELGTLGDVDEAVGRFDLLTTKYRSPHHRVWALAIRGGRALARGAFDETERLIDEGMNVAPEVFQHAIQGFAGQLCTLRIEQGRAAEMLDAGRDFVAQYPQVPAWRAGLSVILAELGLYDEARDQVAELAARGLDALRRDQEWLFLMGALAETCSALGDAAVATECYELLAPFADRCIVLGDGYVLWCSAEKSLGILALAAGRSDLACRHLDQALTVHRSIDARPLVARTQFEHARALLASNIDAAKVAERLSDARRLSTQLGQYGLVRAIERFASERGIRTPGRATS
jgi:DNA-binding SARP family transcriptional activator/tetratricopeptide (TPR) repeat protein